MSSTPTVEYGSFYKFVTSIGVFFIAAAGLVPWAALQLHPALLVSTETLSGLTNQGEHAVREQQRLLSAIIDDLPATSFSLFALGVVVLLLGLIPWYPRQRKADEREDAETEEARLRIQAMTPAQTHEKDVLEAESAVQEAESASTEPEAPQLEEPPVSRAVQSRIALDNYIRVEGLFVEKLQAALRESHSVRRNVRISGQANFSFDADALAEPLRRDGRTILVEVKVGKRMIPLALVSTALRRTAEAARRLSDSSGAPATGLAIFVSVEGDDRLLDAVSRRITRHLYRQGGLPPEAIALLATESGLQSLEPGELRRALQTFEGTAPSVLQLKDGHIDAAVDVAED